MHLALLIAFSTGSAALLFSAMQFPRGGRLFRVVAGIGSLALFTAAVTCVAPARAETQATPASSETVGQILESPAASVTLGEVHEVSTVEEYDRILAAADVPVLVKFGAEWCPPCRMMEPVLRDFARERAGSLLVLSVDIDAVPTLAMRYGVEVVPATLIAQGGTPLRGVAGYMGRGELAEFVDGR